MTALQVYAILNKRIKGLISGVKSAVVNGTSIIWTMNDKIGRASCRERV